MTQSNSVNMVFENKQPMTLEAAKRTFATLDSKRMLNNKRYWQSWRYYMNRTNILFGNDDIKGMGEDHILYENSQRLHKSDELFFKADNRIPQAYHRVLVDQKAHYCGANPPDIDVDDEKLNNQIKEVLGDDFGKHWVQLMIDASLAGCAWIHYWIDDDDNFQYARVAPDQVTPVFDENLDQQLLAARRTYDRLDSTTGEMTTCDEYWTDTQAQFFKIDSGSDYVELMYDYRIPLFDPSIDNPIDNTNVLQHDLGTVPFIPFMNNADMFGDLPLYRELIDVADKTLSGFINNIDDIQQVILVLTNYGDAGSAQEFKRKLKLDGVINIESYGENDKSGVSTLTIDIPTQAFDDLMDRIRELIFLQGRGVDPLKVETGSNNSGVALKMLYNLLELKCSALEAQFRPALAMLIRAILKYLGDSKWQTRPISQSWTRASIQDDLERAQMVQMLAPSTSKENIAKNNPFVGDWQAELDAQESEAANDQYSAPTAQDMLSAVMDSQNQSDSNSDSLSDSSSESGSISDSTSQSESNSQ